MISKQYILEYILEKYNLQINDVLDPEKNGSGSAVNINNTKLTDNLIKSIRAFVEELIIRGELADNYVYYNKNHNNFEGLANWAKLALEKGKNDTREYIYTQKEFENASTHDTLWNAAQNQMMRSGKMHGYMRMYWAKKILEWTSSPEEAIEIALYLNDKYSIDGWSPGGYIGVLWSIGGLHDRAWFARPVFSTIRYMAVSGCEKKFNIKEYKEKWNTKILLEENKLF
jgi:deoxyribodipyrimidine photo-lyase